MQSKILSRRDLEFVLYELLDVGALTGELERISNDLMVDITLDEPIRA